MKYQMYFDSFIIIVLVMSNFKTHLLFYKCPSGFAIHNSTVNLLLSACCTFIHLC